MSHAIRSWCHDLGDQGWPTWVLSNHDFVRQASRWGGRHREARMRLTAMLLLLLGGTPCLYQGEELGLVQGRIPRASIQDPSGQRYWPFFKGRDGSRTPMQWSDSAHGGFSSAEPWLPVNPDHPTRNYEAQRQDEGSLLHLYRRLIELRRSHRALSRGSMVLPDPDHPQVVHWVRSHHHQRVGVWLNLSPRAQARTGDEQGTVLCSTHDSESSMPPMLRPHEGVVVQLEG